MSGVRITDKPAVAVATSVLAIRDQSGVKTVAPILATDLAEQLAAEGAVAEAIDSLQAAVDAGIAPPKRTVRLLVTTNVDLSTAAEAGDVLDGLTLVAGDRIGKAYNGLVGHATNGGWIVQVSGAAQRAPDMADQAGIVGARFEVDAGSHAGETWAVQNKAPVTVGVTAIAVAKANSANATSAEVVAARGGAATVGNRLDGSDVKQRLNTEHAASVDQERTDSGPLLARGYIDYPDSEFDDAGRFTRGLHRDGTSAFFAVEVIDHLRLPLGEVPTGYPLIKYGGLIWRTLDFDEAGRPIYGITIDGAIYTDQGGVFAPAGGIAPEQAWGYVQAPPFRAWDASTLAIIIVLGQSLATGLSDIADGDPAETDPLQPDYIQPISTTPLHPGYALMFDAGAGVGPWVRGRTITGLKDLREVTDDIPGRLETVCSGIADAVLTDMQARLGYKRPLLMACVGESGYTLPQIARGSAVWAELVRLLDSGQQYAAGLGKRLMLAGVVLIQGEAEHALAVDATWLAREQSRLLDDVQAEARYRLNQVEPVRMLVSAPSRGYRSGTLQASPATEAGRIAARRDTRIAVSTPVYAAPHGIVQLGGAHPIPRGYRRLGYAMGDAAVGHFFGDGWQPLEPLEWWWTSGTVLRIKYNMPGARYADGGGGTVTAGAKSTLVIDTSGDLVAVPSGNGRGYRAIDASGEITINSVALVGGTTDQLDVTLATPPGANFRLLYAPRTDQVAPSNDGGGAELGPRGVIRCDLGRSIADDPVPVYHWLIPHEIRA